MIISLIGIIPGLVGMAFAASYWLVLSSGVVFGFLFLSSGQIGYRYGAEVTHPAQEGK